jgi:hypothetical protein
VSAEIEEMLRLYAQHQDTQAPPVTGAEARARVEPLVSPNDEAKGAATEPNGSRPERPYLSEPPEQQMVAFERRRAPRRRAIAVVAAVAAVIVTTVAVAVTRPRAQHQPKPVAPASTPGPAAQAQLYLRDQTGIERANLDGTGTLHQLVGSSPVDNPDCGLAVDRNYLYWETGVATVARARRDGTALDTRFIVIPGGAVSCVAVDGAHIFWVNPSTGAIGRANLDGTSVNQDFIRGPRVGVLPCGIVVGDGHLYWGNASIGAIGRANLDGTSVNQDFISGLGAPLASGLAASLPASPCGVVVDGAHIYWGNSDGTIGRANIDGTGVEKNFIGAPMSGMFRIACAHDSTYLYWAHTAPGTSTYWIGRARLDGSDVQDDFIGGVFQPTGCAVGP